MSLRRRSDWSHHVDNIIRSGHYTWIGEGQAGQDIDDALTSILTDMMHICERQDLDFSELVERARIQFEAEQEQLAAERYRGLVTADRA